MSLPQKSPKNSLLFESRLSQNANTKIPPLHSKNSHFIWSDHLIFVESQHDTEFWNFTAFDLLMNEKSPIRFPKINKFNNSVSITPLTNNFGFISEKSISHFAQFTYSPKIEDFRFINIVKIDWDSNEFQLVERIKRKCTDFNVLVDKSEPSKFVLYCENRDWTCTYQTGKLFNGKIELGENQQFIFWYSVYFNEKLIDVKIGYPVKIKTYDMNTEEEKSFEIDTSSLLGKGYLKHVFEWANNNRLYITVQFKGTKKRGIVCVDLITKSWKILDFETNLQIQNIKFLNGNLMVATKNGVCGDYSSEVEYHRIPIKRPNSLRYSAWLLTMKIMKVKEEKDPYKSAKEFLPLNSDLREIWFKDE